MRPDIVRRVMSMFIWMVLWVILSSLIVAALSTGGLFPLLGTMLFFSAMICTWAGIIQFKYASPNAVLSRIVLLIFGVMAAWSGVMLLGFLIIDAQFDPVDSMMPLLTFSIFVNVILLLLMLFLPVYLLELKPGKYYLISYFGQSDHEFDIEFHPFERQSTEGEKLGPGALINRSRRMWIRPTDTACTIWESKKKLQISMKEENVPMGNNMLINLEIKANFNFDPNRITDPNFAETLSKQSSIAKVDEALQKIVGGMLVKAVRNHYYDKPHNHAGNPHVIKDLADFIKHSLAWLENTHGLSFNDNSLSVVPQSAPVQAEWGPNDSSWKHNYGQVAQITFDAYRGDNISRYQLYEYLLHYPDLQQRFLPLAGNNLTLHHVDQLLQSMNYNPQLHDMVVSEILRRNYYNNMLPTQDYQLPPTGQLPPAAGQLPALPSTGQLPPMPGNQMPPQQYIMTDSQQMQAQNFEHPAFQLTCSARHTVMISWTDLYGEMLLHVDGQTMGPYRNAHDSLDTGRISINQIDYTWNGNTYYLGKHACQQPPPQQAPQAPPIIQQEPAKRRRHGPTIPKD